MSAVFAPWISPFDPGEIETSRQFLPPSATHWFGTDDLGRDLFSRIIYAGRISLSVGLISVGISGSLGVLLGTLAGYFGGKLDALIMRLVDIFLAIPTFFLILSVIAFLRPSIVNIMVVIGVTSWMGVARLIRAEVMRIRSLDYIQMAIVEGCPSARIIFKHIIPNALPPVLVAATLGVASAILLESSLSFLGLGVQPPTPSWGNILMSGKDSLDFAWWLSIFPGVAILVTVLSLNLVGENLRERIDPKGKDRA